MQDEIVLPAAVRALDLVGAVWPEDEAQEPLRPETLLYVLLGTLWGVCGVSKLGGWLSI